MRQHELCSGLTTEQEKQTLNGKWNSLDYSKGKMAKDRKEKSEITEVNVCGRRSRSSEKIQERFGENQSKRRASVE